MFLAAYESRNFAFEAAGDTAADAIDFLKQALAAHAQEYSLADDWWNPDHWTVENLFSVREVTAGCAYRDGQKILGA